MKFTWSSFRTKIIVTLVIVVSTTSFIFFQLYSNYLSKRIYKDAESNYITLLQFFRNELITINNGQLIRGLLVDMEKEEGVLKTYLFDSKGKFISTAKDTSLAKGNINYKELTAMKDDITVVTRSDTSPAFSRAIMRVKNIPSCYACHSPATANLGYILIDFSLKQSQKKISYSLNYSIIFTILVAFLLSIFVAILHYRFVKKSLSEFRVTINQVNSGNLNKRVEIAESVELGQLGKNFNKMLENFQKGQNELQKYHQNELSNAQKLATIGEMAARLAHEVRNPLMGIANAIEVIVDGNQNSPDKPILEELQRQAGRVNQAISNLLKFTRSSDIHPQEANINEVVSSLVFFLGNQKQNKVVQFVTDLQQDIPLFKFDPEQVENVLLNLGINSIQSLEDQGTITFRTSYNPGDQFVNIQVEDDGIGIPEDKKDDVFSPFFTTRTEGTGLGLAIAKEIVEKHNGSIHFYANEGKGTTFEVKLPV